MVFKSNTLASVAVLVGAMVGAGFLGIPYVVAKSGFIIGAIHIIGLGILMLFVNLYFGEISLRTSGNHQLTGYAEKYLGKTGKAIMFLILLFGVFSAILAYTVGMAESISFIIFGDYDFVLQIGIFVWVLMTFLTFFGMRTLKQGEIIGVFLIGAFLIAIVAIFATKIEASNLMYFDYANLFLPFGTVLFAFISFSALPELERILEYNKEKMKKAIIIGSTIPIVGYLLFTLVVVGLMGSAAPEVATIALGTIFVALGIITMSTSYFVLVAVMKSVFHFDYGISKTVSWVIISLFGLNLFLLASKFSFTFSEILSAAGIVSGSITGILSLMMLEKAKKNGDRNPEYNMPLNWIISLLIAAILMIGSIMSLINL